MYVYVYMYAWEVFLSVVVHDSGQYPTKHQMSTGSIVDARVPLSFQLAIWSLGPEQVNSGKKDLGCSQTLSECLLFATWVHKSE